MARSIEQLVDRQFLRWVEQQNAASEKQRKKKTTEQKPMITVSREFGARGAEIAKRVASALDFQFHGQELVHDVAKQARVRRQLVESLDERARDDIEQWVTELMEGGVLAPNEYLRNLMQVIGAMGRHGRGVIVGRGGQFILQRERTLCVRAFAPLDTRVAGFARKKRIDLGLARAEVQRVDAERMAFYRQHFNADVADPHHYDLLLNTASLPLDACVELVVSAFQARFK